MSSDNGIFWRCGPACRAAPVSPRLATVWSPSLHGRAGAAVFALPRVTRGNDGYGRTFLSQIPLP